MWDGSVWVAEIGFASSWAHSMLSLTEALDLQAGKPAVSVEEDFNVAKRGLQTLSRDRLQGQQQHEN